MRTIQETSALPAGGNRTSRRFGQVAARDGAWRTAMACRQELHAEIMRHARMPGLMLLALLFPSLLYAVFVCGPVRAHDTAGELVCLANDASLAAIAPGLFAFGLSVAHERQNGFLNFKRALPMPRYGYFGAKCAMCMLMTLISVTLLLFLARLTCHAVPSGGRALLLGLIEICGTLPFCALGMLIGSFWNGRRVAGLLNLLLVPPALFSGLLVPLQVLPHGLRAVAMFSPGCDLQTLALASITPGFKASPVQALFLVASTLVMGGLARWRLRRAR
jgi:ABC-2 type transport system permease protein